MRILHLTDIHLDHLEAATKPVYIGSKEVTRDRMKDFMDYYNRRIREDDIDFIVLTGDISVSRFLPGHLKFLEQGIKCPVYFVLGNHDFYGDTSVFGGNSMQAAEYISDDKVVMYLTQKPYLEKDYENNKKVAFVGVDGWYDGKYSNFDKSDLYMTDFDLIEDFKNRNTKFIHEQWMGGRFQPMYPSNLPFSYHLEYGLSTVLKKCFAETAERFAELLKNHIQTALKDEPEVIIVGTHVPPFVENSLYKGKVSDENWLPFFSSKSTGDVLLDAAKENQNVKFIALCGHSHGESTYQPLDNLICHLTAAEYGSIYQGRLIEV